MKKKFALLLAVSMICSIFAFGCQNAAQRPLDPNQSNNLTPNKQNPNNQSTALKDDEVRDLANRLADKAEEVEGVKRASVVVSDNMNRTNNTTGMNNSWGNNRNSMTGDVGTDGNAGLGTGNLGNNETVTPTSPEITDVRNPGNVDNNNRGNNFDTNNSGLVVMVGIELDDTMMNNATNMDNIHREVAQRVKEADNRISQVFVTTDTSLMKRIDNVASNIANGQTINAVSSDIDYLFNSLIAQGPAF